MPIYTVIDATAAVQVNAKNVQRLTQALNSVGITAIGIHQVQEG